VIVRRKKVELRSCNELSPEQTSLFLALGVCAAAVGGRTVAKEIVDVTLFFSKPINVMHPATAAQWNHRPSRQHRNLLLKLALMGQSPWELRFSLSHFLARRTSSKATGPETTTRSACRNARFVIRVRLSATAAAASRRTMSIMTGSRSVAVAARIAERPSLSCRCFLSLTRITACWHAVRHCGGAW
jgi:hypothetical protein